MLKKQTKLRKDIDIYFNNKGHKKIKNLNVDVLEITNEHGTTLKFTQKGFQMSSRGIWRGSRQCVFPNVRAYTITTLEKKCYVFKPKLSTK